MSGKLTISFNWLPREYGNIIERLTFADLFISADSLCLTELADQLAKTVRRGPRVSLYLLAQWFVANWWRLRWEPERPKELSWLMSHKIGAAGSGYCWPDLSFCSDGWAVAIHGQPTQAMESQMVRYLQGVDINIPALEFEQEVDSFVDAMINRLASEAPAETELANLWKEVLQERRDPQLTEWRKLEAFLGYDPDEAPGKLVEALIDSKKVYGTGAVEEMAVASTDKALSDIESLWNDARPAALQITIPDSTTLRDRIQKEVQPSPFSWQRAKEAAKIARMAWSIKPGPISNKVFFEILELNAGKIGNMNFSSTPVTAGFRENDCMDGVKVLFNKRPVSGQRFALARLLADHLNTDQSERLLPACDTATQRQKFQRAFAQEFLCPFEDMIKYFGSSKFNDEAIEALADQFIVSPLLVRTTLVNNGVLERACL